MCQSLTRGESDVRENLWMERSYQDDRMRLIQEIVPGSLDNR